MLKDVRVRKDGRTARLPVPAHDVGGGLFVNQCPFIGLDWSVTHEVSGYAVIQGLRTKREALVIARRLLLLADWTRPARSLLADKKLEKAVRALRSKVMNAAR
jgi:homoaconitase/3-isopropylmalate dehydratase large subunit